MAQDSSFDIISEVNLQTIDDAVNIAMKEIVNRFDFKGMNVTIEFKRNDKEIELNAPSEMKIQQMKDIMMQKMIKKEVSFKALSLKKSEKAANGGIRETYTIVTGIDKEIAKTIVKDIKDLGLKVQASIQEEKVRISGKSKDDLQNVIKAVRDKEYPIPLQFSNYR
ncbi:MAG TPA: YajQ family cyclic di-GMP-binding protein [Spirochaetota bacterium]|nr:YajQ family cyclic di-GMP-binding protein [Spirochaetota bacterium]